MEGIRETRQFGRRETGSIVISSNGKVREYKISKTVAITAICACVMLMSGYLAATAYLLFRDDVLTASLANQVRMKHEYEDRIAALRAKVDRITSRQLLDQQAVEAKVAALMRQQAMLSGRSGTIEELFEKAGEQGISPDLSGMQVPVPQPNPQNAGPQHSSLDQTATGSVAGSGNNAILEIGGLRLAGASVLPDTGITAGSATALAEPHQQDMPLDLEKTSPRNLFAGVSNQIRAIEDAQLARLTLLQQRASARAARLAGVFAALKVPAPSDASSAMGGPYMPAEASDFDGLTETLSSTLAAIDHLEDGLRKLPVHEPIPGAEITSRFGNRVDPFFRKSAFHGGMDFRARTGKPVQAAGAGKVVTAGRSGGYGLMVEIDHGNGITSRYAHLSKLLVSAGDNVDAGKRIGLAGSTGRSTGPHLHFEVRRGGKPANPERFLDAGEKAGLTL